jgi:hypothetical protein
LRIDLRLVVPAAYGRGTRQLREALAANLPSLAATVQMLPYDQDDLAHAGAIHSENKDWFPAPNSVNWRLVA